MPHLMHKTASRHVRPQMQSKLLVGFLLGTGAGILAGACAVDRTATDLLMRFVVRPIEYTFLLALFLLIFPLLVSSIISGIARLRDLSGMGRLLSMTALYMVGASFAAALIGLAMANLFRPGEIIPPDAGRQLVSASPGSSPSLWLTTKLPYGAFEQSIGILIVVSILVGITLTVRQTRRTGWLVAGNERIFDAGMRVLAHVTRLAPIAVACFTFDLILMFGWYLLLYLSAYVGVVIAALVLQLVITFFAVVWMRGGVTPLAFLREVQEPAVIAFCTSSSNATLPSALKAAELDLRLPARVARLVLGTGTVANQTGTAIYTAVTVLFIAQFFGIELSLGQQGIVLAMSVLAGMGTIGVPAGALPTVAAVLALTGVPAEGIGLVVGVDRLLDMFRTTINVVGDLAIATAVSRDQHIPPSPLQ